MKEALSGNTSFPIESTGTRRYVMPRLRRIGRGMKNGCSQILKGMLVAYRKLRLFWALGANSASCEHGKLLKIHGH